MDSTLAQDTETFWSRFADNFERGCEYVAGRKIIEEIIDTLMKQGRYGHLLELGCGNGTYTRALSKLSDHVVTTDLSDEMLTVAECRLTDCDNVSFDKINCLDIPYQSGSFDTVFMANLVHVICDPSRLLLESHRLIKPGGRIIIVSFTQEGMSMFNKMTMICRYLRTWGKPPREARSITVAGLAEQLKSMGFLINDAMLLGDSTKALFVSAEKV